MNCCGWMGGGMMLMWLLFLLLIVVGIILLVRAFSQGRHEPQLPNDGGGRDALEILEERYARGEIDRDEFEERRRILQS